MTEERAVYDGHGMRPPDDDKATSLSFAGRMSELPCEARVGDLRGTRKT